MSLSRAQTALSLATDAITDRQSSYGTPASNFARVAAFWNAILSDKLKGEHPISAADVAMMMSALKLARLVNSPDHLDSAVDGAAYLALLAEVA